MSNAIRLTPSLREKIWGKKTLEPWLPNSERPIGEAWFLGERELPLLVKLLFTSERLSVQVHPADGEAGPRGKTEMWHILEAEPGAKIALGFREPLSRERLREVTRTGEIEDLLSWVPVKPGQTFLSPAHTVHAIGAGIVLCEIQQNSDVTYRLWDYGRPRELHVEQAIPLCDLGVHPGPATPVRLSEKCHELVRCRYFVTEFCRLSAGERISYGPEESQLIVALNGCGTIGDQPYRLGEVWLLPESGEQEIQAETDSHFLRTYVPR